MSPKNKRPFDYTIAQITYCHCNCDYQAKLQVWSNLNLATYPLDNQIMPKVYTEADSPKKPPGR